MTKYAELYFAEEDQNKFLDMLLRWRLNLKYEEKVTWEIQGVRASMPMTYTRYRQMPLALRGKIFKKIEKKLQRQGITHVILPKLISTCPFQDLKEYTGNYIKPFFIMGIINFIVEERLVDKNLQNLEIVMLDGSEKEVDMLIDFIYPYINHLTIVTKEPERFKQKSVDIFEDVGLNMQVLSYTKGAISQGDIIIDTHYDDPMVIHLCKARALYLDIGNHAEKTAMLLERKRDVTVIDEFLLEKNGEVVSTAKAEMLLMMNQVFSRNYKETMKRLKKQNVKIYKLAN